jgi:hypothetical protein
VQWRRDGHRSGGLRFGLPDDYLVIDGPTVGAIHMFCAVLTFSRWAVRYH